MSDRSPDLQLPTRAIQALDDSESTGTVRWFSPERGFGFIAPDDGGDDVFVRHSSIQREGFRSLDAGQRVAFKGASDNRGPRAIEVRPLG